MLLRAILARRLTSVTILALTMLVVAGTVVVVGFSRLTDVSQGTAGALILLGFVGLSAQTVESVRQRQPELALARLRGRHGVRLLTFAVAGPGVVVVVGTAAGLALGWFAGRAAAAAWLAEGTTFRIDSSVLAAAGAVMLGSVVLVVLTSWRTLRAPLQEQIAGPRRPRTATAIGLFLQVVLVLGAIVAVYQAHGAARSRVDWVSLVSPGVVGLAAGQVVIWLTMAVLAIVVARGGAVGLGWFITVRRLLRRADSLAVVRMVVASAVVAGVAASASSAAQDWRENRARLQLGGPVSFGVPDGALRAYAAAEAADPEGQWLLPVASYTATDDGGSRRVFVASSRWSPVVGDFFEGTSAGPVTEALERLRPGRPVTYSKASQLSAILAADALPPGKELVLTFQYVNDTGDLQRGNLTLRSGGGTPISGGRVRFAAAVMDCTVVCSVAEVDLDGDVRGPVILDDVTFGPQHPLAASTGVLLSPAPSDILVARTGKGLRVRFAGNGAGGLNVLGTFRDPEPEKVVSTSGYTFHSAEGERVVSGIDGYPRQVQVVAKMDVLPFVGTRGSVLDLGRALAGSGGGVVETDAKILARDDTPAGVLAALGATGAIGPASTYTRELARLGETPRAQGTRLYALIAAFAGLIALLAITSTLVQQSSQRRREAASLRSVGLRARDIDGTYRREALLLALLTFVATSVAAWSTCRALLPVLPLVSGWTFAPPLDTAPKLSLLAPTALGAGGVVGLMTYVVYRGLARSSPPRMLREDIQ